MKLKINNEDTYLLKYLKKKTALVEAASDAQIPHNNVSAYLHCILTVAALRTVNSVSDSASSVVLTLIDC